MGLATDCLLIVNNHRDRFQDEKNGKKTLAVKFGKNFSIISYYILGIVATFLSITSIIMIKGPQWSSFIPIIYLIGHLINADFLRKNEGKALNKALGKTAMNIFAFSIFTFLGIVL